MKFNRTLAIFAMTAGLVLTGCNKSKDNKLHFYTVTWLNYDGEILEVDNRVMEGSMPTYNGATPTRADDGQYAYTFEGWTPEITKVHANQEYTATYSQSKLMYTIDFDLNGGESESYQGERVVEAFTPDIFFFDVVREDWNFRGWLYKGVRIFDEKGNLLQNPEMERRMTFVAMFSQTVKLNIVSNITAAGSTTGAGEYPYNTDVDLSAEVNPGYEFDGWYYQNNLLSINVLYCFRMWSDDVTIEARFRPMMYVLEVESNNFVRGAVGMTEGDTIDNEHFVERIETYVAYTHRVKVTAFSFGDTRFLGWFDEEGKLVDTNAVYKFVMPMGNYYLEAKWDYFEIEYVMNGGTNDIRNPYSYTLEDDLITLYTPTRGGYEFLGWKYNDEYITEIDPSWMANIKLVAVWKGSKHTLSVTSINGSNGSTAVLQGEGYTDEVIKVQATPNSDSVFLGWFSGNVKLSSNTTYQFTMPSNNYTITAQFQSKRTLGITPYLESSYYYYGQYPQSKITDGSALAVLNSLAESAKESNGCYIYRARYYYESDGDWFLCSVIKWRKIISDSNGYVLIAESLLDCRPFSPTSQNRTIDGKTVYPCNYKYSRMREFFNGDFINMAFLDSSYLRTRVVDNSKSTTISDNNSFTCDNTSEKVFALSYKDYNNSSYGFSSSADRKCKTTEFARSMTYSIIYNQSTFEGVYFTRSPDNTGGGAYVSCIDIYGAMTYNNAATSYFIRPAISTSAF